MTSDYYLAKQSIESMQLELDTEQYALDNTKRERDELQQKNAELKDDVIRVTADYKRVWRTLNAKSQEIDSLQKHRDNLLQENSKLKGENESLKNSCNLRGELISDYTDQIQKLTTECQDWRKTWKTWLDVRIESPEDFIGSACPNPIE